MPKTFQDIVKVKKNREEDYKKIIFSKTLNKIPPPMDDFPSTKQEKPKSYRTLWFVALISVVFLFFAISFLFSSATVTINPKTKDFVLNKTLTATKSTSTDSLSYDLVVLSGEEKKEVKGGEEKDYLEYAKGSVLIYNSFSSLPQPLSIDTRLEGSNGKIYKTKIKVVVPGMEKSGTPGKIGVDIYGAEVGDAYNSTPLDFKILGFKGTSKYSKIYARSVGDITGGLKGKSSQVSDVDKTNALKELNDTLFMKLFQKAKNQIPPDFVLLNGATFLNVDEENMIPAGTPGNFTISIKGTFDGILFNKEKLTKEVVKAFSDANSGTDVTNVYVSNIESLSISSFDQNLVTLDSMKDITFNLSGTAKIVWKIDADKLVADLLGKSKKDFTQILSAYPDIDSAVLSIKPVWKNSFPDKIGKIKVIINYPK